MHQMYGQTLVRACNTQHIYTQDMTERSDPARASGRQAGCLARITNKSFPHEVIREPEVRLEPRRRGQITASNPQNSTPPRSEEAIEIRTNRVSTFLHGEPSSSRLLPPRAQRLTRDTDPSTGCGGMWGAAAQVPQPGSRFLTCEPNRALFSRSLVVKVHPVVDSL